MVYKSSICDQGEARGEGRMKRIGHLYGIGAGRSASLSRRM